MLDWQKEFKIYVSGKLTEKLGQTVKPEQIDDIKVNIADDLTDVLINELIILYAFAIMEENYERANVVLKEFDNRNFLIKTISNPDNKTGAINVYSKSNENVVVFDLKMKIEPNGMIIDFEKENF